MAKDRRPLSPSRRTFPANHADGVASVDFFVAPTINFKLLFGLSFCTMTVALAVTAHPTADWLAQQISEAFPWESAPRYLIGDRGRLYSEPFRRCVRSMGIRDRPIAPRCPRQNAFSEPIIGSIRRESLDHPIICNETHLRHVPSAYTRYHNSGRLHLYVAEDAPFRRAIQPTGQVRRVPRLGGPHCSFARI